MTRDQLIVKINKSIKGMTKRDAAKMLGITDTHLNRVLSKDYKGKMPNEILSCFGLKEDKIIKYVKI